MTGGAVVISAIGGTAGIGKTALALHWAHEIAHRFPDGQLFVDLQGFDHSGVPMTPDAAMRGFLDAFEFPKERIPASPGAQAGLLRTLLAGRRVLMVLDNARDIEQIRPLLPGSPGCLVVVTSRNRLTGLVAERGAHPLRLNLMPTGEARQFLALRIGSERTATEPRAVDEIIARCGGLPLALAIVAARAAAHPEFLLRSLASQLRAAHGGLDALESSDPATDVRAVFSWSYRALSNDAARLFRLLSLHPGPDVAKPAVASLSGTSAGHARRLLDELTGAHLVVERTPERYALHDLLRAYASELAHEYDSALDRHAATHRLFDYYLSSAHAAALLLYPHRPSITLPLPQLGAAHEDLTGPETARSWFITEHEVLRAAVGHAAKTGLDTHAWQLAWTISTYLDWHGHWHDWIESQRAALSAARRSANRAGQAHAHRDLGRANLRLGCYDEAQSHLLHALGLFEELDDLVGQGSTHSNISAAYQGRSHYTDALRHEQRALDLYQAAGNQAGKANALNNLGWLHSLLGEHELTLDYCRRALSLHVEIGDRYGEASTLSSIGHAEHHLGDHRQAAVHYQRAANLLRELGDRRYEAETLISLGETHQAAGDPHLARAAWQKALEVLEQLGHPDAGQARARLEQLKYTSSNGHETARPD